jgi:Tfp pilus assembly protein PilO
MSGLSNLSTRDRRALMLLAVAALVFLGYRLFFMSTPETVAASIDSVPLAERRLNSLRQIAAALPAKEAALKQADAELEAREKSIISAGTAAQAQARLLEVARRVGNANGIEIRGGDFPPPKTFGDVYGEVFAGVSFTCPINQFVNFFADLSREPDLIAPSELPMMSAPDQKSKILTVRMILSGVVPRKLVPEKKGYGL